MSGREGRGRGAYYKEKYGGGRGRGRGSSGGSKRSFEDDDAGGGHSQGFIPGRARTSDELAAVLQRIDGKSFPAYHDIEGSWQFAGYALLVERAQGDPYAAPTRVRVQIPAQAAGFPAQLLGSLTRRAAVCDFLTRAFGVVIAASGGDVRRQAGGWGGEKGGEMRVDLPGRHVLQRTSVLLAPQGGLEARFTVALPAKGRTILGRWASAILLSNLPRYVAAGLTFGAQDAALLQRHVEAVEDTEALRRALAAKGLVAFVGNGAILPRASGASDAPMQGAVIFKSPPSLEVEIELPNAGSVRGMGIRKGITLIVGGGYNGKSTLLEALEMGIYNKVPGDGRELVATDPTAVKIQAEDGRRVAGVDISPFINGLPAGRSTADFSSEDASGSTSQAANIQEALEVGASTLLLDEDTCASNFMHRDDRMRALVAHDPITPFSQRIRSLAAQGVSCVLVNGASSDFFESADTVVSMESFVARDVTADAKAICQRMRSSSSATGDGVMFGAVTQRCPLTLLGDASGHLKTGSRSKGNIFIGEEVIDIDAVEQLVEQSQTRSIAAALLLIHKQLQQRQQPATVAELVSGLERQMDGPTGLDAMAAGRGDCARPRGLEIAAALNRVRSLRVRQQR